VTIYFYSTKEVPYGCFSNFSAHSFVLDGKGWPTSEHYFQAQKFAGTPHAEEIRLVAAPMVAARMGRERSRPLRPDWNEVKDDLMRRAVLRKFESYKEIADILLSTGDEELVEKTSDDYYWGCGTNGKGENMLGKILMEVRQILRERAEKETPATQTSL
jgi:N-glycosidase YbiA